MAFVQGCGCFIFQLRYERHAFGNRNELRFYFRRHIQLFNNNKGKANRHALRNRRAYVILTCAVGDEVSGPKHLSLKVTVTWSLQCVNSSTTFF